MPPQAPVVVFVHGGALTAGDKNASATMYANVLYYFARHGFLGVNANYRLAPQSTFPGGAEDVGAVVGWVRQNAARLGANPERIVLVGHSSGGTHVATWAYDRLIHGPDGPRVAGIVLVSARLKADNRKDDPNAAGVEAYFGSGPERLRGTIAAHRRRDGRAADVHRRGRVRQPVSRYLRRGALRRAVQGPRPLRAILAPRGAQSHLDGGLVQHRRTIDSDRLFVSSFQSYAEGLVPSR